jgi:hypothetical protein
VDDPRSQDEDEQEPDETGDSCEPEPVQAHQEAPEPAEPQPARDPEPAPEPEPVAQAPQPEPVEADEPECVSYEDPEPASPRPETPRPQTPPLYNVQTVMSADQARDLTSWPAETDVIQAERAVEGEQLKSWPESEDFEDQPDDDQDESGDGKKVPTWLRFFTGSRD